MAWEMARSNNGGDNDSFEENPSLLTIVVYAVPPPEKALRGLNALDSTLDPVALHVATNLLFNEKLYHFIVGPFDVPWLMV
ncbi:UNVERIFIED_CONTAM: hypothetical protein Sradi_6946600 [Sesamum radiatum]|uniref:Uncharacterized protein n=1 Tax=Sesamum radiatum TaxID=300843 RepID=A0AAW2JHN2_SESRA